MTEKQIDKSNISIFGAQMQDIPDWLTLVDKVANQFPGLDRNDYLQTLKKNIAEKTALCAKSDGTVVGILLFSLESRCLLCLAVHPECRRLGVATGLISEMLRRMPDGDISVTTFRADDPQGSTPRALYQKFGFVPDELLTEFHYPVQRFVLHRPSGK